MNIARSLTLDQSLHERSTVRRARGRRESVRRTFLAFAGIIAAFLAAPPVASRAQPRAYAMVPAFQPYRGVDASFIPQYEAAGVVYYDGLTPRDPLTILRDHGANLLRLRVWNAPPDGACDLPSTLAMARRARALGMSLLIDLHYSDSWADPGQQTPPAAWTQLSDAALREAVRTFTADVVRALESQGTPAAIVQIGNEVIDGMLWPRGRISTTGWENFVSLLNAGIAGARQGASPFRQPKIMVHIDRGGDNGACRWYFDNLRTRGVAYDIIGLSYYPWWHGGLASFNANVTDLSARYGKSIFLAETAYPFTLQWQDGTNNFVWQSSQLLPQFPATPMGQRAFMEAVTTAVEGVRGGMGVCYWAPEYVAGPGLGSPWENLALFDFGRVVLPSAWWMGARN